MKLNEYLKKINLADKIDSEITTDIFISKSANESDILVEIYLDNDAVSFIYDIEDGFFPTSKKKLPENLKTILEKNI